MAAPSEQLSFEIESEPKCGWGGKRAGSGRKLPPVGKRSVPHIARAAHAARFPIHVTLRARKHLATLDLRTVTVLRALHRCLEGATKRGRRITEFSLQTNH